MTEAQRDSLRVLRGDGDLRARRDAGLRDLAAPAPRAHVRARRRRRPHRAPSPLGRAVLRRPQRLPSPLERPPNVSTTNASS